MHRGRAAIVATLCAVAIVSTSAASANAAVLPPDQRAASLWHADMWDLDGIQSQGATGEGVKIAVIDTFLNPDVPELAGANVKVRGTTCLDPGSGEPREITSDDPALAAHGTNVVSMIVGNGRSADGGIGARGIAPKAEVWFYGVGALDKTDSKNCKLQDPTVKADGIDLAHDISWNGGDEIFSNDKGAGDATALAARAAIRDGADVISVSVLSGGGTEWSQVVFESLVAGVPIISGVLNPDTGFKLVGGPYDINGVFPVNAIDEAGKILTSPTTGSRSVGGNNVAIAAPGSGLLGVGTDAEWGPSEIFGTSYAAPLTAGAAALGIQKFPDASRFQVMQSMLRTTGSGEVHDINWENDGLGAGYLNPSAMLTTDPMNFPEENPQWVSSLDDPRCVFTDTGERGKVLDDGRWSCAWSVMPYPPGYEAYRAVFVDGEPLRYAGVEEESPYSKQPANAGQSSEEKESSGSLGGISPLTLALIVGGAVVLLAGIVVAIAIPVSLARKRQLAFQESQQPPVGGQS